MDVQALDRLDVDHPFMLGLVSEHGRTGNIADGIDALHIGAADAVRLDDAAIDGDAERFEPEPLDIAGDADRRDHPLDLDGRRGRPWPA